MEQSTISPLSKAYRPQPDLHRRRRKSGQCGLTGILKTLKKLTVAGRVAEIGYIDRIGGQLDAAYAFECADSFELMFKTVPTERDLLMIIPPCSRSAGNTPCGIN